MFPFSLFTSSIKISDRIESLRDAESKLLEFAKTRFVPSPSDHHSFELFDTPIAPPSVLKDKKNCQVFDDEDVAHYSLHGVKVVNQQLLASSDDVSSSSPAPL
eukprot:scaffold484_cov99-Skeletonema_dohrnii-CCMP3373.AAC.1